jgi:hypothetical protein
MKKYWFVPVVLTFLLIAIWSAISASPNHDPVHIDTHNPADFECTYNPIVIGTCRGCEQWGAMESAPETPEAPQVANNGGVPFCQLPPWTPTPEGGVTVQAPTPTPEPPDDDDKVTICHKPGTPAEKTMEVPQPAVQGHLNHGDYIGECIDD